MLILVSTLILAIIGVGLKFKHKASIHMPCMLLAFVLDIGLVLYIELTRHAVETFQKEIAAPAHNGLLLFHISVSLLTILLYIVQIVTGYQLFKGKATRRRWHKTIAVVFLVCRLANYVTSFFINV